MKPALAILLSSALVAGAASPGSDDAAQPTGDAAIPTGDGPPRDGAWTTWRVGGDLFATTERQGDLYQSGSVRTDAPLPAGYPAPTPPGSIELKQYPMARRAEVSGQGRPDDRGESGFWPLFNHIQSRDIPMTAPVEMDYAGMSVDEPTRIESWTMAFLYEDTEQGQLERDGNVEVVDTEPVTVISIGVQGRYGVAPVSRGVSALKQWLDANPEWEVIADPRALNYNGPMRPPSLWWSEVQLPVRRVTTESR